MVLSDDIKAPWLDLPASATGHEGAGFATGISVPPDGSVIRQAMVDAEVLASCYWPALAPWVSVDIDDRKPAWRRIREQLGVLEEMAAEAGWWPEV
jgi:hypothetical protein